MFLVHNESDNTLFILGSYVHVNEGRVECGLRLVHYKLGIRLEKHNELHLRHSSIIILDVANHIHHQTYQGEFWLEALLDGHMRTNVNTSTELSRHFTAAPGMTFQWTICVLDYPIKRDYGLLMQSNVVMTAISSN